jgi:hypothetical protein
MKLLRTVLALSFLGFGLAQVGASAAPAVPDRGEAIVLTAQLEGREAAAGKVSYRSRGEQASLVVEVEHMHANSTVTFVARGQSMQIRTDETGHGLLQLNSGREQKMPRLHAGDTVSVRWNELVVLRGKMVAQR